MNIIRMSALAFVLSLSVSVSAFAAPPATPFLTEVNASTPDLRPEVHEELREEEPGIDAPIRLVSGFGQTLVGFFSGWLGAGVGVLIGFGSLESDKSALVLGLVGYTVGTATGVWATGEVIGWDGSFGAAVVGTVGGAGLGIALALASRGESLLLALASPSIGGSIGYQLSADWGSGANVGTAPNVTSISIVNFEF